MSKLERELEELVQSVGYGGGFGEPQAAEHHQREIDLLKFKITRRDQRWNAVTSAVIGASVAVATLVIEAFFN